MINLLLANLPVNSFTSLVVSIQSGRRFVFQEQR